MLFLPHMEFIWAIWVSIDLNVSILSIFKINSKFSHKNGFQNSVYEINDIWNNSIVFSYITAISFTRDKLLNIRKYTPPDISPAFIYSDVLLDIVVGEAAVLFEASGCQNIDMLHVPPETVIYWITVTQQ